MPHSVELLLVRYTFDESRSNSVELPDGLKYVGSNDVNYPLCIDKSGRLVLFDRACNATYYLAPGIAEFARLATQYKQVDSKLAPDVYATEVRTLLNNVDPALLTGGFWSVIVEEIEAGIL